MRARTVYIVTVTYFVENSLLWTDVIGAFDSKLCAFSALEEVNCAEKISDELIAGTKIIARDRVYKDFDEKSYSEEHRFYIENEDKKDVATAIVTITKSEYHGIL